MTIKTVGIAGTGLIGAGWAARLLFRGYNVIAFRRLAGRRGKLKAQIKTAWPSLEALLGKPKKKGKLTFTTNLAEMAAKAGLHPRGRPRARRPEDQAVPGH
jgi:carnitine 3-dehydrogenase